MSKWKQAAEKRMVVIQADEAKARDMEIIVEAMQKLPPGQLKKFLTDDVLAVLEKYGVTIE